MTSSEEVGQYRGLEWRFRNAHKTPVMQPSLNLVYRGVAYETGTPESEVTPHLYPSTYYTCICACCLDRPKIWLGP
ncbi:DUF4278 domain-containing protein [Acaryochloris sp. 'Moss Beach']|uniref:DUF4278 domain-containing protein n=1 Tax=Acaryochloris sp. 'Moss Beach' TaxID=2740837 RepID=UPI001F293C26|nr:DUF4278 domain-containing protein [Acaryochloris sp. 'Moss Beach']